MLLKYMSDLQDTNNKFIKKIAVMIIKINKT